MIRLVLAGSLGCRPTGPAADESAVPDPLPRAVAVAMVAVGGQPVTAYFSVVPNPRGHIDVRVANNLRLPGERAIFEIRPDSPERTTWSLHEAIGQARVPLHLPGTVAVRPVRFESSTAWLFPTDGPGYRCDLHSGDCAPTASYPSLELTHSGPGSGFRLALEDRTLRFRQPHQPDDGPGEIVATRVLDVLSIRWLHDLPDAAVMEHLDRTFRGRGTLHAGDGAVVVDGDMDEWDVAEPVVVDAPWQAATREHWHGPSDASFSVAARVDGARVCFGGRIRDDELSSGDQLAFALGAERATLTLATGEFVTGSADPIDLVAVVTPEAFGWHFEACELRPTRTSDRREVAFAAWYRDQDGADAPDELATAPVDGDTPTGTLDFPR